VLRISGTRILICLVVATAAPAADLSGLFTSPGAVISSDTVVVAVSDVVGSDTLDAVWFRVRFCRDTLSATPGPVVDTMLGLDTVRPFSVTWACGDAPDQDDATLTFYCEALTRRGAIVGGPATFARPASLVRSADAPSARALEAPYSRSPLVFDGRLHEWPSLKVTEFGPSEAPVRMRAFWNEGFLCMALQAPAAGLDLSRGVGEILSTRENACATGVALFLDIMHDRDITRRGDDLAIAFSPDGGRRKIRSPADTTSPLLAVSTSDSGYTMEIALTCASLGLSPHRNGTIGFGLSVFGCDTARGKALYLDWAGTPRLSASLPGRWGTLVLRKARPWWHFAAALAGLVALALVVRFMPRPKRRKISLLRDPDSYSLTVRYAIQLLDENSRLDTLDLRELAETLYLTGPRLARMIHRETGYKVQDFIAAVRLSKARRLLVETVMPVAEIAAEVGLANARTLDAAFEAATGEKPAAYRTEHGVAIHIGAAREDDTAEEL